MLRFKGRCTVTVQPAGSAGERRVFITVSGDADTNKEVQIELVVRERAANNLADVFISGSVGVMRELTL